MKYDIVRSHLREFLKNTCNSRTRLLILGATVVFLLTSINSIFYSVRFAFGYDTGTFIFRGDLFADFFKVIFSYPYASNALDTDYSRLPLLLKSYVDNNPYKGISGIGYGELTHFHLPPFTTSIVFVCIKLFDVFGVVPFSISLFGLSCFFLLLTLKLALNESSNYDVILILAIASYPLLFIIQRGNFFSFFATLTATLSVLALRRGYVVVSLMLISLAINVRPNLIVFLPIYYFLPAKNIWRPFFLIAFAAAIFVGCLHVVNAFYPDYSIDSFFAGLSAYKSMYVYGDGGFGYSTSLYTLLKYMNKLFGLNVSLKSLEVFVGGIGLLAILIFTCLYSKSLIAIDEFVLLLTTLGMLSTQVFADYHLLIFILPILVMLGSKDDRAIQFDIIHKHRLKLFLFCVFMLAPVNYVESKGVYVAPFIKTLAALWICLYIPVFALKNTRPTLV